MDATVSMPKFAILGAGHGGTAMAGHLSLMGLDVSLYNRTPDRLNAIRAAGGLEILTDYSDLVPRDSQGLKSQQRTPRKLSQDAMS